MNVGLVFTPVAVAVSALEEHGESGRYDLVSLAQASGKTSTSEDP